MVKQATYHLCDVMKYHLWVARASGPLPIKQSSRVFLALAQIALVDYSKDKTIGGVTVINISC